VSGTGRKYEGRTPRDTKSGMRRAKEGRDEHLCLERSVDEKGEGSLAFRSRGATKGRGRIGTEKVLPGRKKDTKKNKIGAGGSPLHDQGGNKRKRLRDLRQRPEHTGSSKEETKRDRKSAEGVTRSGSTR